MEDVIRLLKEHIQSLHERVTRLEAQAAPQHTEPASRASRVAERQPHVTKAIVEPEKLSFEVVKEIEDGRVSSRTP